MRWDFRQEFFSFEQYVDQRSLRLHILAVKKVITGLYLWSFVYLLHFSAAQQKITKQEMYIQEKLRGKQSIRVYLWMT